MFRSKLSYCILAAGCAIGLGTLSTARAGVFENTLSPTFNNQVTIPRSGGTPAMVFEEFKAGATSSLAKLNDLEFEAQSTGTTGSLVITLWTDSTPVGGTPTSLVATLGSIAIASITNTLGSGNQGLIELANLQFTNGTQNLIHNGEYWIGFQQTGVNAGQASATKLELTSTIVSGSTLAYPPTSIASGTYIEDCTSSDTTSCEAYVSATAGLNTLPLLTAQAPEPATLAILGSALTGLGLIRRRRAKRNQAG